MVMVPADIMFDLIRKQKSSSSHNVSRHHDHRIICSLSQFSGRHVMRFVSERSNNGFLVPSLWSWCHSILSFNSSIKNNPVATLFTTPWPCNRFLDLSIPIEGIWCNLITSGWYSVAWCHHNMTMTVPYLFWFQPINGWSFVTTAPWPCKCFWF